jgi:hypothetical protein
LWHSRSAPGPYGSDRSFEQGGRPPWRRQSLTICEFRCLPRT